MLLVTDDPVSVMAAEEGALLAATRAGRTEEVRQVLEEGREDVNQVDREGETPLIIASCLGHAEVIGIID